MDPTIFTNFMRQNVQGVIVVQTECEDSCTLGILRSPLFFFIIIIDQKCFKFHLKIIAFVIISGKNMVDNRG